MFSACWIFLHILLIQDKVIPQVNFSLDFLAEQDGIVISDKGDGKQFTEKSGTQTTCGSAASLAFSQNWKNTPQFEATECGLSEATIPSLWGQSISPPDCECNVFYESYRMALRPMPQNEIAECLVLRPLWQLMGRVRCAYSKSAQPHLESADQEAQREKPEAQAETEVTQKESTMGTAGNAWVCKLMGRRTVVYDLCDRQREWKRNAKHAGCIPTTAAATYVGTGSNALSDSMDAPTNATTDASNANDALPTATAGPAGDANSPTAADSSSHGPGRSQSRDECAVQTEQDHEGCEERGPSFARIPVPGAVRAQEGRQREHQQPVGGGQGSWKSKRGAYGSGKLTHAVMVAVACLSPGFCDQVEGIYGAVPGVGDSLPTPNAGSHNAFEESTEKSRYGQEACRCYWQGGRDPGDLRRRHGRERDGLARRREGSKRRECATNSRGLESGCYESLIPLRVCRQARAQVKVTQDQRRRRCSTWFEGDAAFSQDRCFMTDEYDHQWPQATCSPDAVPLHWGHSILKESCFTSPWNAVERAPELAWELGIPCSVRVDIMKLSPRDRKKKNCHSVRFEGHDDSLKGKVELEEFQPCIKSPDDTILAPIFHTWPKRPLSEPSSDPGRNLAPRTSAGSASHRHFLDRILPDDLPAYIHHLQTLWKDDLLRLPAGQQYRLRTWYIHHLHQPKCRTPRVVKLVHDPGSWHQGLLAAWRDQIHDDELLTIAVVFPRVRDQNPNEPTQADVMLIQGQQDGAHALRGGVTTVYLPGDDRYYIGAASYARHLSGVGILEGVDAAELLQTHACDIFHGGTAIPSTLTPVHWTANGHSFVAVFHDLTGSRATSSTQRDQSPEVAISTTDPQPLELDEGGEEESPQVSTSSFDEEDLQGLQVFRLGQPAQQPGHHCFVRWRSYNMILFDTLHSMGIHRDRAVGFHYVQAPLIDQHEAEEAIILQLVGDIPGGSADKLVLIDLTYHTAGLDDAHQRIVRRFPRFLSRPSLITQLHLQAPCEDSPDSCTFHFNNDLWNEDDLFPRELQHGTYLRVEVTVDPPTRACAPATSTNREVPAGPSRPDPRGAAGTTDVSSFMQRSSTLKGNSTLLMSHSATFPSLAGRQGPGTGRHHNSRRIAHEQQHSWMPQAKMMFRECAAVEFDDEGPVLYWTTWFLHYQRYTKSFESRILRLDAAHRFWFDELCNLWADAMDPHRPARVAFVHPTPPEADDSQHVGHLILVQGQGAEHPVLLTALFDHAVHRRVWHLAALQPNHVGQEDILEDLGIARWCNVRRCRLQVGDIHLEQRDLVQLQDGESIVVTIPGLRQVTTETDVSSFMQMHTQTKRQKPPDRPNQLMQAAPQTGFPIQNCGNSQLNPYAPAFDPRQPDLRTLSEFEADLWAQWDQEAFTWEDEERSCTILTWFVDHTWQWPHCDQPRRLQLYEDYHQWEWQILDRWHDVRDHNVNYEIHVVDPRPPSLDNDIAAHVIIMQRPQMAWITNLATIIDEAQVPRQSVGQIAITTHEHVRAESILTAASLERVCLQPPAPLRCQVWFQGFHLPLGILFPGRSGTGIEIHLWPTVPAIPHTEGHSLLQTQSSRRREEERLTGSAVAHACRPSPVKLQLSDLLEDDEATNAHDHTWGVKLKSGHEDIVVPEYIEIPLPAGPIEVEQELCNWGIICQAVQFVSHDQFLCLPRDHQPEEGHFSYMAMSQNCVWNVPRCSGRMERRGFVNGLVPDLWNVMKYKLYININIYVYCIYV